MNAISASGLEHRYPDGVRAVEDVSLSMGPGESVGLIGPSGAGKTTLLLMLAGLLEPQRGDLLVFGKKFGGPDERDLRRRVGFVFQETEDQLFSATVFDDVAFGPLNFGMSAGEVKSSVARALRQVGLEGYESRVPHHLSSGEKRRVAIATVISYGPDLLILDEPSSDLDPRSRRELAQVLREMRQGLLIASHDFEFILRACDRVLLMDRGRIGADGESLAILGDEELLRRHGLEPPLGIADMSRETLRARLGK